ncbi:MAG: beta-N-acetylhexosaminidase [Pyrinomonadaceae bacterium]
MRRYLLLSLVFTLAFNVRAQAPPPATQSPWHNLMPVPESVQFGTGRRALDSSFAVAITGYRDARLEGAVTRTLRRLAERTGMELPRTATGAAATAALVINCQGAGAAVPTLGEDESYALEVTEQHAALNAPNVVGVLRGLETFLQLVEGDEKGYFLPAARIDDRPRFPWRGLLIDVCRHWEPVEVIERNLDGMAAVKLNVLHLHLTEDQGFRIESKKFPKLQQFGSDGLYYTQADIRRIIAYARERGIRVVPEFDIPGHTTSWLVGQPELASAPGPYQIARTYGVFDAALDPTRDETYKFLDKFLGEMAALFPDAYLHIGGDEVTGKPWRLSPRVQAFMAQKQLADKHALQAYFNQRIARILQKHHKKMIGWDEILHPDLPQDIVIQSWRGQKSLAEGAKKGYAGILSSGYYLDHLLPAAKHYEVDPVRADAGLTEQEAARILGGEACMWGEYIGPETIDSRIWPRLAAIAERLWSPRTVTDVSDMYRRLEVESVRLEELGLTHRTYAGKMLRRLAGGDDGGALETLATMVEPIKFLKRGDVHPITQQAPLTRLVDAAAPESQSARAFAADVTALLDDAPRFQSKREQLRARLAAWREVQPAITALADKSPIMRDAAPLADALAAASGAGLEALQYLTEGRAPSAEWRAEKLALLDGAAQPKGELELPIIPALRQLVLAAAELEQLKTMSPADWKAHVLALAAEKK